MGADAAIATDLGGAAGTAANARRRWPPLPWLWARLWSGALLVILTEKTQKRVEIEQIEIERQIEIEQLESCQSEIEIGRGRKPGGRGRRA